MSKSTTFVAIFAAILFGGIAGYFLRDAQVANEKIRSYNKMPAPAAGVPSISLLVPERSSTEYQILSYCSGLLTCQAKQKDGNMVSLHVVREGSEVFVSLGETKLSFGAFTKALKNQEFEVADSETGRLVVQ